MSNNWLANIYEDPEKMRLTFPSPSNWSCLKDHKQDRYIEIPNRKTPLVIARVHEADPCRAWHYFVRLPVRHSTCSTCTCDVEIVKGLAPTVEDARCICDEVLSLIEWNN